MDKDVILGSKTSFFIIIELDVLGAQRIMGGFLC